MSHEAQQERRRRLMERLGDRDVALVRGASDGGSLSPNFFYLTGLEEPGAALLLAPGGVRIGMGREHPGPDYQRGRMVRQVLFLPRPDPLAARWGEDAAVALGSVDEAKIGVDAILPAGELRTVLSRALGTAEALHVVRAAEPSLAAPAAASGDLIEAVRRNFLNVAVRDATPLVGEMRRLKDAREIEALERSIAITAEGIRAVMRLARPGMHEHELEAELTRVYRTRGAVHGFDPIVAAGANACLLHYKRNSGRIDEGDLLLIDTGAALARYGADVTRTFPVAGRFDGRQREVYEAVLEAQRAAIGHCRPGAVPADIHAAAWESIEDSGFAEHFIHGTAHHLGLETHDVGDPHRPLAPGAVITVEPGIYLPDESIGVRIEDDVLITEDGCRVLSEAIPKSVEAVEAAAGGG